jgi:hypothetical protein
MDKPTASDDLRTVSEKNEYLWAFITLKSGLSLIEDMNEQVSKVLELKNLMALQSFTQKDFLKSMNKYTERLRRVEEKSKQDGTKQVYIALNPDDEFEKQVYDSIVGMRSCDILREMSLVYVIAIFENFLQRVLQISFIKKPEALKTCQKNLTYEELLKFTNLDSVKNGIIEKEIMIVNEDIEDVRRYVEMKFAIEISQLTDNWKEFKERFYRRNIIIHNSGIPNKLYKLKTGYEGSNERLTVSKEYLDFSLTLFTNTALKICAAFEDKMRIG